MFILISILCVMIVVVVVFSFVCRLLIRFVIFLMLIEICIMFGVIFSCLCLVLFRCVWEVVVGCMISECMLLRWFMWLNSLSCLMKVVVVCLLLCMVKVKMELVLIG